MVRDDPGGHGHSHGLAITLVILRITLASWRTVRAG
jgi:hypothetical protein